MHTHSDVRYLPTKARPGPVGGVARVIQMHMALRARISWSGGPSPLRSHYTASKWYGTCRRRRLPVPPSSEW